MCQRGWGSRESRPARSNAQESISCSVATVEAMALKWSVCNVRHNANYPQHLNARNGSNGDSYNRQKQTYLRLWGSTRFVRITVTTMGSGHRRR